MSEQHAGTGQPRQEVVGAAILRHGRVLTARRATAPAGVRRPGQRWEFPGGKVEPGETRTQALVRELREELDCTVEVVDWLGQHADVGRHHRLFVATARLVEGEPVPREGEHDAVRWVAAEDLHTVDWLDPDRPFLVELADLMRADLHRFAGATRAIFFDAEDAERVRARLVADGYAAEVARERYAGEDDDEDHAWAVLTDAPAVAVELLVDAHDGWLDDGEMDLPVPPPLDLPAAPKRHHRAPDGGG